MAQKQAIFTLLGGKVQFRRGNYHPTADAVWLAAFANVGARGNAPKTVLDVGIGTGGVALCLLAHHPDLKITGIDISEPMLGAAAENAGLNGRGVELIRADINTWKTGRTFDLVMTNPPYFKGTPRQGTGNEERVHHNADLYKWTRACLKRVKPLGAFYTIVDAAVMAQVIAALHDGKAGDITIIPLLGAKKTAERVLIGAKEGGRGPARLFSGLSMNDERVLRDGLTIDVLSGTVAVK